MPRTAGSGLPALPRSETPKGYLTPARKVLAPFADASAQAPRPGPRLTAPRPTREFLAEQQTNVDGGYKTEGAPRPPVPGLSSSLRIHSLP